MANQTALKLLTRPGDDVVLGHETHMVWHESGAGAANAGVQFTAIGKDGLFTAAEFRAAANPAGHMLFPPTTMVATHTARLVRRLAAVAGRRALVGVGSRWTRGTASSDRRRGHR